MVDLIKKRSRLKKSLLFAVFCTVVYLLSLQFGDDIFYLKTRLINGDKVIIEGSLLQLPLGYILLSKGENKNGAYNIVGRRVVEKYYGILFRNISESEGLIKLYLSNSSVINSLDSCSFYKINFAKRGYPIYFFIMDDPGFFVGLFENEIEYLNSFRDDFSVFCKSS